MNLKEFFEKEKIYEYSILPFDQISIIDERRAKRLFQDCACLTVVPFLIPYLVRNSIESNISVYAHARDYHLYFNELSKRLNACFGDRVIAACDTSPINEVECAVKAGLGAVGKHGLLINRRYGTYVFLGEFYFNVLPTDPLFDGISPRKKGDMCLMCGACLKACPQDAVCDKSRCISYINQKKKLDEGDAQIIKSSGSVWGCDICQEVCPVNRSAEETEIAFFKENRTPYLTEELLDEMIEKDAFSFRAYAWRGEGTVRRNIRLCQEKE